MEREASQRTELMPVADKGDKRDAQDVNVDVGRTSLDQPSNVLPSVTRQQLFTYKCVVICLGLLSLGLAVGLVLAIALNTDSSTTGNAMESDSDTLSRFDSSVIQMLSRLSLEQKIAQMTIVGQSYLFS